MVGLITLTGGLLVTGYATYRYGFLVPEDSVQKTKSDARQWRVVRWLKERRSRGKEAEQEQQARALERIASDADPNTLFGLMTSALSLSLTTAGLLVFPPLAYASIPTLVFMGIPSAQNAYDGLRSERRVTASLVETAALALCFSTGQLWVGSLGFTLYYAGRAVVERRKEQIGVEPFHSARPDVAHLFLKDEASAQTPVLDGATVEVPVFSLKKGDRILLESGEVVPVDGVILEGGAWLRSPGLSQSVAEVWKGAGQRVYAMDVLMVGRICLHVQSVEA